MQPVQDIQIGTRISRTQFQYTLIDTDAAELDQWAPRLLDAPADDSDPERRRQRRAGRRLRTFIRVDRDAAMRLGVSMQAIQDVLYDSFGQRQISTIFSQSNQYRVVLETESGLAAEPRLATEPALSPGLNGAQVPLTAIASIEHVTAPAVVTHDRSSPPSTLSFNLAADASLGDAVQPIADAERDIELPATISGSYSGDAAEFQQVTGRRAVADPGGGRGDLHRARRAVREHHPPHHHPFHPAIGRHRRAAGVAAIRAGPLARGAGRHRAADGHRQEERHHDDRLRHRSRTRTRYLPPKPPSRKPACCGSARS